MRFPRSQFLCDLLGPALLSQVSSYLLIIVLHTVNSPFPSLQYSGFKNFAKKLLTINRALIYIRYCQRSVDRKGGAMEEVKFTVKMLAAYMRMSIERLAEQSGISADHLLNVSSGRVKMTGEDVVKLSEFTKIPAKNIEV